MPVKMTCKIITRRCTVKQAALLKTLFLWR